MSKKTMIKNVLITRKFVERVLAERGGFEPPVGLSLRQFSKLLVSATHPSLLFFLKCSLSGGKNIFFFIG